MITPTVVEQASIPHDASDKLAAPVIVIPGLAVGWVCKMQVQLTVLLPLQAWGWAEVVVEVAKATACTDTLKLPKDHLERSADWGWLYDLDGIVVTRVDRGAQRRRVNRDIDAVRFVDEAVLTGDGHGLCRSRRLGRRLGHRRGFSGG